MEQQVRKFKRDRDQDHLHKERTKKKKKKKQSRAEVQPDGSPALRSTQLQAEEQRHSGNQPQQASPERKKENKKKKKKEKNNEDFDEGSLHIDILEEAEKDYISREEQKVEGETRKKEKKGKTKEEVAKENRQLQRENDTMGFDGLDCDNPNRVPIEGESTGENENEKKTKKVTFEDNVIAMDQEQARDVLDEVGHSGSEYSKDDGEEIWGVRFTPEEDGILKDAVWTYIKSKGWDEHAGLEKVFNSKKHKDARDCWAEIKMSLPHRPRQAVRFRARLLLEAGGHLGKWSKEEEDLLKRLQSERGHKWREFSFILNRQRSSIKEKWRSLKRSDALKEKGGWTQDELQQLSKMVHESLRMNRFLATKKQKLDRHILRDNICWEKIANSLGTHNHGPCCSKWYYNLQSSLVADGHWANQDDFLLLESLLESGASAEEEVEWDNLLEHRSGQVCLTRWKQMVKHLGENRTRQFLHKLDILARRYAPELLETSAEDSSSKNLALGTAQES